MEKLWPGCGASLTAFGQTHHIIHLELMGQET